MPRPLRQAAILTALADVEAHRLARHALGQRPALEKVALAGNRLRALPDTLTACSRLALLRLEKLRI